MPSREELAYAELMNLESQGPQLRSRTPQKSKFQMKSWAVFGKYFVTEIFRAECSRIFCWKMLFITLTENSMGLSYSRGNSGSSEEIPVNRLQRRANTFFRICASETGRIMPRAHTERETVCEMMIRDYFLASIICHDQGYKNDAQNTWQVPQLLKPGTAVTRLISSLAFSTMVGLNHSCGSILCKISTGKGGALHFPLLGLPTQLPGLTGSLISRHLGNAKMLLMALL